MADNNMHLGRDYKLIPMTSIASRTGREVANDVYYYTNQIVNIIFIGHPNDDYWYLVDAGLPYAAKEIMDIAEKRFGEGSCPQAIILTHGHFDHVGGVIDLVKAWDVPVYAHSLEFPHLTGEERYPMPDGSVEGGFLAKISPLYPIEPIQLGNALHALPEDGHIPGLDHWKWFHTPGHSPGHISLFRKKDRMLLSGDALITVRQDSFYNVFMQTPEINGPPVYMTSDWDAAWQSIDDLFKLKPELIIPGHGVALQGVTLEEHLKRLEEDFELATVPEYGPYVSEKNRSDLTYEEHK